jgi:hypothetical protein
MAWVCAGGMRREKRKLCSMYAARSSVVGWGTGRSRVRIPMRSLDFSVDLTFPALSSTRNEYRESSWGVKGSRRAKLTASSPSVSRLSRQNVGTSTSHKHMGLHGLLHG